MKINADGLPGGVGGAAGALRGAKSGRDAFKGKIKSFPVCGFLFVWLVWFCPFFPPPVYPRRQVPGGPPGPGRDVLPPQAPPRLTPPADCRQAACALSCGVLGSPPARFAGPDTRQLLCQHRDGPTGNAGGPVGDAGAGQAGRAEEETGESRRNRDAGGKKTANNTLIEVRENLASRYQNTHL